MGQTLQTYAGRMPVSGVALDCVKIIAALLMLADHWDDIILDRTAAHLMLIGRAVFPLFCFATAAAVLRAGEEKALNYTGKILLLAVFVEPVSQLSRDIDMANILFTLAIGAAFIPFLARLCDRDRMLVFGLGLLTLYFPSQWEYGMVGALLPAAMYFVLRGEKRYIPWLIVLLALVNFNNIMMYVDAGAALPINLVSFFMIGLATIIPPWIILMLCRNIKGEQRLLPKYFLHVFYPLHLICLALINPFV